MSNDENKMKLIDTKRTIRKHAVQIDLLKDIPRLRRWVVMYRQADGVPTYTRVFATLTEATQYFEVCR